MENVVKLRQSRICKHVAQIMKDGARSRRTGDVNPYPGNTVQHLLHAQGWLTEDLRLALIRASPSYAAGQAGFGRQMVGDKEQTKRDASEATC